MTLITWGKPQRSILVEAGLVQGEKSLLGEYQANNANFKFKAKNLDYVSNASNSGLSALICSVLLKRKPALLALIIPKSLWLSPDAIVS